MHSQKRKQTPPTFLPPPLSPSCALQRALWEPGKEGVLGFSRVASSSGVPEPAKGTSRLRMNVQWQGGGLYLSCCCLMYTHLFYLLPNKRNTSVLPTETARARARRSPRAQRCWWVLRAAEPSLWGPRPPVRPWDLAVWQSLAGCWQAPLVCPRWLVRRELQASGWKGFRLGAAEAGAPPCSPPHPSHKTFPSIPE